MELKHTNLQRRSLLRAASLSAAGLGLGGCAVARTSPGDSSTVAGDPWARAQDILDTFKKPLVFRKQDFPITAYGAAPCKTLMVSGYVAHHEPGQVSTPAPDATDCPAATMSSNSS